MPLLLHICSLYMDKTHIIHGMHQINSALTDIYTALKMELSRIMTFWKSCKLFGTHISTWIITIAYSTFHHAQSQAIFLKHKCGFVRVPLPLPLPTAGANVPTSMIKSTNAPPLTPHSKFSLSRTQRKTQELIHCWRLETKVW